MIKRHRKTVARLTREQVRDAWREEIAADVFELWLGISRLMARVRQPYAEIRRRRN